MFTKLERNIIWFRVWTVVAWVLLLAGYVILFVYNFVAGILFLWFPPYWIWFIFQRSNLYVPKHGYFRGGYP